MDIQILAGIVGDSLVTLINAALVIKIWQGFDS